jgi:hypothetical protein
VFIQYLLKLFNVRDTEGGREKGVTIEWAKGEKGCERMEVYKDMMGRKERKRQ